MAHQEKTIQAENHNHHVTGRHPSHAKIIYACSLIGCGMAIAVGLMAFATAILCHATPQSRTESQSEEELRAYQERLDALVERQADLERATIKQIVTLFHDLHARQLMRFGLTEQELEIATQAAMGENNAAISKRLYLAESTIKYHLSVIYRKTGTQKRGELKDLVQSQIEGLCQANAPFHSGKL